MANLGQKNGIYHIRFRFYGKEYKKSLKTSDADSAAAAKSSVELTIHRLLTGLVVMPTGIEPGDFILSGGTLQQPRKAPKKRYLPSTNQLDRRVSRALRTRVDTLVGTRKPEASFCRVDVRTLIIVIVPTFRKLLLQALRKRMEHAVSLRLFERRISGNYSGSRQ